MEYHGSSRIQRDGIKTVKLDEMREDGLRWGEMAWGREGIE